MPNHSGLTSEQAAQLLKQYGLNEIKDINRVSALKIFLRQIQKNFVVYLLIVTAAVSFFLDKSITGNVILVVIGLVVSTGFIQEYRAEKAIHALKQMIMPVTRVIRDGKEQDIQSSLLVPGDLMVLRNGERVAADGVILEASELRTNEAILTGESSDVKKSEVISQSTPTDENQVFMGTYVVNGKAIVQVVHTGMQTKFGQIASMISTAEKHLPLQDKVNRISKYMASIGLIAAFLTGLVLVFRAESLNQSILADILIIVIALSVSSFPEGFPVVLIATLAAGVSRMAKQNAVVNRMSIIETLGETSVICTDKTGTLTKGEMTVRRIFSADHNWQVSGVGYHRDGHIIDGRQQIMTKGNSTLALLLKAAILCNDAKIEPNVENDRFKVSGSSTEVALLVLASKLNVYQKDYSLKRVEEMPFDSTRKMMSTAYQENGQTVIYAKGAPEVLLEKCRYYQTDRKVEELTEDKKQQLLQQVQEFNSTALRSLAIGYKLHKNNSSQYSEDQFILLGIIGMEDPPREEVTAAISQCLQSGIKVKMITGDHTQTALAIAKQIGLEGPAMDGKQIDSLTDDQLRQQVGSIVVFSRVQPGHKLRIVQALKANNEIVTMTGDGVNDAPALKEAHIGVAMGINGTDVSRSVADITLKDDNFATIVTAIREGRTIFNNIRKFVTYQLSCNFADIVILFIAMLAAPYFGWQIPIITALQILFINIVTDNMPAITLGFNPTSKDIMKEAPRKNADILTPEFLRVMAGMGVIMGILALIITYIVFNVWEETDDVARTTVLLSIILMQIANAFNFRSFRSLVLTRGLFINRYLMAASVLSIAATLAIIYTPLNLYFETVALPWQNWGLAVIPAFGIVIIADILKVINNQTKLFVKQTA